MITKVTNFIPPREETKPTENKTYGDCVTTPKVQDVVRAVFGIKREAGDVSKLPDLFPKLPKTNGVILY